MNSNVAFEQYDNEFSSLVNQIEEALSDNSNFNEGHAQHLVQQSEDLVKQMAIEARSVPDTNVKRDLLQQVRQCKSTLGRLVDQMNQQSLFSGSADGNAAGRERLLQNEQMLSSQNDTLENARRVMEETEAVALEITEELGHNREKLVSAHGRVREVTNMTGRARRLLQSMNQRAMQQKLAMYAVGVGFVIFFFVILMGLR